jgi:tRNA nucleotidyltransferase/poly(A) polymerase
MYSFRRFLEETQAANMHVRIPLPQDVFILNKVFEDNGFELRVVGGAVRDYLIRKYEVENMLKKGKNLDAIKAAFKEPSSAATSQDFIDQYRPKDVDLTTNARPEQMAHFLTNAGIVNRPQGEAFGVWIARPIRKGGNEYEIASYREDGAYTDGRRPDSVSFSTAEKDYGRRDFTMNGLIYVIPDNPNDSGEVIDYSGGQGLEDIKTKTVRPIGNPFDRFGEDKLRVLRAVRFHSRYNDADVLKTLDPQTLAAIKHFKDVRAHGVSGPRIFQEFLTGFKQAKNTQAYLKAYQDLGLLDTVFPGLHVDLSDMQRLGIPHSDEDPKKHHSKNAAVVLAWILRKGKQGAASPKYIREKLNQLNFPNDIADEVEYLLRLWNAKPEELPVLSQRVKPSRRHNIQHLVNVMGDDAATHDPQGKTATAWQHFARYEPPQFSGEEIMRQHGISQPGPEVGRIQKQMLNQHYQQALRDYIGKQD